MMSASFPASPAAASSAGPLDALPAISDMLTAVDVATASAATLEGHVARISERAGYRMLDVMESVRAFTAALLLCQAKFKEDSRRIRAHRSAWLEKQMEECGDVEKSFTAASRVYDAHLSDTVTDESIVIVVPPLDALPRLSAMLAVNCEAAAFPSLLAGSTLSSRGVCKIEFREEVSSSARDRLKMLHLRLIDEFGGPVRHLLPSDFTVSVTDSSGTAVAPLKVGLSGDGLVITHALAGLPAHPDPREVASRGFPSSYVDDDDDGHYYDDSSADDGSDSDDGDGAVDVNGDGDDAVDVDDDAAPGVVLEADAASALDDVQAEVPVVNPAVYYASCVPFEGRVEVTVRLFDELLLSRQTVVKGQEMRVRYTEPASVVGAGSDPSRLYVQSGPIPSGACVSDVVVTVTGRDQGWGGTGHSRVSPVVIGPDGVVKSMTWGLTMSHDLQTQTLCVPSSVFALAQPQDRIGLVAISPPWGGWECIVAHAEVLITLESSHRVSLVSAPPAEAAAADTATQ